MKRIALFLSLTIFAVFAAPANAQEAASSEALPFLRYERNPARAAMAGAGSALLVGGSATSAFGSPFAAAASANKVEAAASYANWAPSLNSSNNIMAGASVKLGKSLAVSAAFASDKLSEISVNGDKFSPSNTIFAGAVSLALGQSFSLGAAVNLAKSQLLSDYSVSGTAFDLMLCYRKDAFGVAGGVRSLGGKVGNASLPTSFNVSGGYGLPVGPVALRMAADADYYFSGNWSAAAGVEASIMSLVQVRAGYRLSSEYAVIPSHLSLGLGFSYGPVALDLAYLTASEYLGGTIIVGLNVKF